MAVDVNTMEVKKTQTAQPTVKTASANSEVSAKAGRWRDYFGELKDEFRKISWTTPEELKLYTKLVVAMTVVCGMAIYFMDIIIQTVLSGLNAIMHLIGG